MAKLFKLIRQEDVSGISGTGVVAEGVAFESGQVVICWLCPPYSVAIFDSPQSVLAVHGHNGCTQLVWED
jgi:hypothetical protein